MWLHLLAVLGLILLYRWYRQNQILENLLDKYVFITGCDTGFGNLLAKQLDSHGINVLAACLTEKGAQILQKEASSRLQTVILDVTDSQSVSSAAKWASTLVKEKGLWGLVNNAGIGIPGGTNEWLTKDDFMKVINVNLLGTVDVILHFLPLIRKARGRIVNVSSVAGRINITGGGYCISKYGIESFSDSLRREMYRFGVKVCIIEPGFFSTQITSTDLHKENIKRCWEKSSEEIREAYGEEYFRKICSSSDNVGALCTTKLSHVTNCIEHALIAVHPWARYSAGWGAKFILVPLSYLPTAVLDFLLIMGQPKPAQGI
ncbi:PREDICTED: retinol dehydrogenase 16-like [Nanorana parkeri]|uniref:retinol dehydrogenase 16-like n=1 Tax=Nanorana parkeri TaxID=125878 RepID=UPI000854B1FC|nr:PREDICTED: retinol dehydrogenase 16-like [Nanorana parkeri]